MFINYPESLGFIGGGPFEIYLDKPDMDFCRKPKNKKKKIHCQFFKCHIYFSHLQNWSVVNSEDFISII